jgi:hypothetical protein
MNDQIEKLCLAAGMYTRLANGHYYPVSTTAEGSIAAYQKFAQLIVKNCVLISRTSTDGFSAGRRMEELFGVEE